MINREENERWTRVGPGTPGGEMLRRYWWPVAFSEKVGGVRPTIVKLLGEEFVVFRDGTGRLGMLETQCAHRRTSLKYARVEKEGIRCCYHGWKFDVAGKCLETPPEEDGSTLKDRVSMAAYQVQEKAGLIFAYIGPKPAPLLPNYDMLVHAAGTRYVYGNDNHFNWLQAAENASDLTHLGWLHAGPYPMYAGKRCDIEYMQKDYGFDYTFRAPDMPAENCGSIIYPCHNRFASARTEQGGSRQNMLFRVPADDVTTLNFFISVIPSTDKLDHHTQWPPERKLDAAWKANQAGEYGHTDDGWWEVSTFDQDRMAAEGQGPVYDRTRENLGKSDIGVAMFRRMLKESIDSVERGGDPVGLIRDPAKNTLIEFGTRLHKMEPALKVLPEKATA